MAPIAGVAVVILGGLWAFLEGETKTTELTFAEKMKAAKEAKAAEAATAKSKESAEE